MVPLMVRAQEWGARIVITHFSKSAEKHAQRIAAELSVDGKSVEFVGYGPWEGQWQDWLEVIKPTLFLTAKYESWPELWMALAEQQIPLIVIAARARRNFYVAEKVVRKLGGKLPDMSFIVSDQRDIAPFKELFPRADVELGGDPRWERVKQRSNAAQPRAKALIDQLGVAPGSCAVLGQVWVQDIEFFGETLNHIPCPVWLTPHDVTPENVAQIEALLARYKLGYVKTSTLKVGEKTSAHVVFVDEVGFLVELYRIAAWAYVGGGFPKAKGVHSTIEPAIRAIPIACAPKNVEKFTEIVQLRESGQLTVLHSPDELQTWLKQVETPVPVATRERWQAETAARIGATGPIFDRMVRLIEKATSAAQA